MACQKENLPLQTNTDPHKPVLVSKTDRSEFPEHWWKAIPLDQKKSWEILPQEAGPNEVILSKRNELGLLSNFAETSFVFKNVCYPNVESFWQMMKYPDTELKDDVRTDWTTNWKYTRAQVQTLNGYAAKAAGNYANDLMSKNNANWVSLHGQILPFAEETPGEHYRLIVQVFIEKIRQNPKVLSLLLQTKNLKLRPDHHISKEAPLEWNYNLLWMDIRSQLQKNELSLTSDENLNLKTCLGKNDDKRF